MQHVLEINPGNIGNKERVKDVIKAAKDYDCAIRIGVNAGSLEKGILEKYKEPKPEAMLGICSISFLIFYKKMTFMSLK